MEIGSQCIDVLVRVTIIGMVANLPRVIPHKDHLTCSPFLFPVIFFFTAFITLSVWFAFIYSYFGEGNGNPLQYSCLENPVDRGAWWAAVHGVTQSRTRLKWLSMHACIGEGNGSPLQYSCLENPRDEEPSGLPSMGSHRVGHNWSNLAALLFHKAHEFAHSRPSTII